MRRFARCVPCILLLTALVGCGANFHSSYRHTRLDDNDASAIFVDAKQRGIYESMVPAASSTSATTHDGKSQDPDRRRVICSEPSPDVFSVIAQAASGSGSWGRTADPKAIQAAASFATSSTEQGAMVARTQTINMLREVMYRSCERYMDGSISSLEMSTQAVRDQRMMVSTLAIEQLTNATRPIVVSIGASGTSSAGASGADAVVRLDDAYKALDSATKTLTDSQSSYDKLNSSSPSCDDIKKTVDAGKSVDANDQPKQKSCADATTALSNATKTKNDASDRVAKLNAVANGGGGAGPAAADGTTQSTALGQGAQAAQAAATEAVAKTVEKIVEFNYNQDEFLLLCLKALSPENAQNARVKELQEKCEDYVKSGLQLEIDRNGRESLALKALTATTNAIDTAFGIYWSYSDAKKKEIISKAMNIKAYNVEHGNFSALQNAKTRDSARAVFGVIGSEAEAFLAGQR